MQWLLIRSCVIMLCCLCASFARAGELPRYAIKARVDTEARRITASQTVTFTNNTDRPTDVLYFHVYPNRSYTPGEKAFIVRYAGYFKINPFPQGFEQPAFHITRLESDGRKLDFSIEGKDNTLVKVNLKQTLSKGQSVTVDLDFSVGIPPFYGRYGRVEGITALARWYPVLSVYEQEGWENHPFYPFHRPFHSEAAQYTVDLTVASNEVVIHSADLVKEENTGDGQKTLHITTTNPIREFSLALSRDYKVVEENHDGINFKSFYLPGHEGPARRALGDAHDLMVYYSKRFGPYPYKSFSIAPVHLGYGGEQMSNMIFIDTRVFDLPKLLDRYFDFLIAHETGHQWFYNMVGVNNFTQMWLEEGINSYFLLNYLEDKYGTDAAIIDFNRLPRWVKVFVPELTFKRARDVRYKMATRAGLERPIISKLSSFNEPSSIFALTYGKGSRVVDMLNNTVGEVSFNRIFARIFKEYAFQNMDITDFMRIAQEESKADLREFFQQWLFTTRNFDARVTKVKGNTIFLERRGGIVMPVDVSITYKDGTGESRVWTAKNASDQWVTDKEVKQVALDPGQKLLDIDRTNNTWPRQINVKPVPLYHGLYDVPALMPDEKYNLIMGPEISNGIGLKTSFQKPYDYSIIAATDYDFSAKLQRSRAGVEIKNILHSQTTFGVEGALTNDYDTGEEDLVSQKVYVRRELWPAPYGLTQVNDHVTLYALRNRTPSGAGGWMQSERVRNTSYLKRNESIAGMAVHFDRSQPRPDPHAGYAVDTLIENSGHWAGATQTFTRASINTQIYHAITVQSKMACRLKYGWGSADDKNLFELGGADGLRGFDRKTVRGADVLLGSVEYRFPLMEGLKLSVADHWLTLTQLSAVAFFDGGQAWRDDFNDAKFHKDAGAGLRLHLTIGSFLEDVIVRLDVAKAIHDKEDAHTWFGINQAF